MKRDYVDFHALDPKHEVIHGRLTNWRNWCIGRPRRDVAPIFRQYQTPYSLREVEAFQTVDVRDALKIEKGVVALPEKHRFAIQWSYVIRCNPIKAMRRIGCTDWELAKLVDDGRDMLINRRI